MKTSEIKSGIYILLLLILTYLPYGDLSAQDQDTMPLITEDPGAFNIHRFSITLPLFDRVRPTLNNITKGLQYYNYISLSNHSGKRLLSSPEVVHPLMLRATLTDLELENLNENMLFITRQYQIQIKEWIRKDKMDWNLGEAIKGFYTEPVF